MTPSDEYIRAREAYRLIDMLREFNPEAAAELERRYSAEDDGDHGFTRWNAQLDHLGAPPE